MDADIHERAKGRDVGDRAFQLHADLQVGEFFNAVLDMSRSLNSRTRIPTRLHAVRR